MSLGEQISSDEHFMFVALQEAKKSFARGFLPVGAVLAANDILIASAGKTGKGHPHLDHADRNVIGDVFNLSGSSRRNLRGMTIYITLEPCFMCFGEILNVRISRVVYALEDSYGGALCTFKPDDFPPRHKRDFPAITGGVLREEARALFKEYFTSVAHTKRRHWNDPENPLVKLCCE